MTLAAWYRALTLRKTIMLLEMTWRSSLASKTQHIFQVYQRTSASLTYQSIRGGQSSPLSGGRCCGHGAGPSRDTRRHQAGGEGSV